MPLNPRLTRIQGHNRIKEALILDAECYIILWITGGKGVLKIDCEEYELITNRVFYMMPGQKVSFVKLPQTGYVLHFTEEFLINSTENRGKNILLEWLFIPQVFLIRMIYSYWILDRFGKYWSEIGSRNLWVF